jgi:hypothetical protein
MPGHVPWRLGAAIAVVLTASCAVDPAVEYGSRPGRGLRAGASHDLRIAVR